MRTENAHATVVGKPAESRAESTSVATRIPTRPAILFPYSSASCLNPRLEPAKDGCYRLGDMCLPEDSSAPRPADWWMVRHNATFSREGRCLLFACYSPSLRDCHACRTIAWCKYYDHSGVRDHDRLALVRWDDDGGQPCPPL